MEEYRPFSGWDHETDGEEVEVEEEEEEEDVMKH